MARTIGIRLGIDLGKVNKDKIIEKDGRKYLNLISYVNLDETSQYGDNGGISIDQTKEEADSGAKREYVGNSRLFWSDNIDVERGWVGQKPDGSQQQTIPSDQINMIEDDPF